jgi:hypothetical protein
MQTTPWITTVWATSLVQWMEKNEMQLTATGQDDVESSTLTEQAVEDGLITGLYTDEEKYGGTVRMRVGQFWTCATARLEGWAMLGFLAGTLTIALGYAAVLKLQSRVVRRDPAKVEVSAFTRARGAIWVVASTAFAPMVAMALMIGLWRGLGLFNMRLEPLVASFTDGVARVAMAARKSSVWERGPAERV